MSLLGATLYPYRLVLTSHPLRTRLLQAHQLSRGSSVNHIPIGRGLALIVYCNALDLTY